MAKTNYGRDYAGQAPTGKEPRDGWFAGNPVKGAGYGKLGPKKHKNQKSIDSRDRGAQNVRKGKGTATRRGDRFAMKSGFSFGEL